MFLKVKEPMHYKKQLSDIFITNKKVKGYEEIFCLLNNCYLINFFLKICYLINLTSKKMLK